MPYRCKHPLRRRRFEKTCQECFEIGEISNFSKSSKNHYAAMVRIWTQKVPTKRFLRLQFIQIPYYRVQSALLDQYVSLNCVFVSPLDYYCIFLLKMSLFHYIEQKEKNISRLDTHQIFSGEYLIRKHGSHTWGFLFVFTGYRSTTTLSSNEKFVP